MTNPLSTSSHTLLRAGAQPFSTEAASTSQLAQEAVLLPPSESFDLSQRVISTPALDARRTETVVTSFFRDGQPLATPRAPSTFQRRPDSFSFPERTSREERPPTAQGFRFRALTPLTSPTTPVRLYTLPTPQPERRTDRHRLPPISGQRALPIPGRPSPNSEANSRSDS